MSAKQGTQNPPKGRRVIRRKKTVNRSVTVVAGIFFIFAIVYLVRAVAAFLAVPTIATEVVKMGSIDVPQVLSGIIVREETVYNATRSGTVTYNVAEFDRVKAGMAVCRIQHVTAVADIDASMARLEEQIMSYQDMRGDISVVDPAVQRINNQIKSMLDNQLYRFTALNFADMYALKDSIVQNLNIRNQMIITDNNSALEDLGSQQQMLQSQRNELTATLYADRSGIVSPIIDGQESILTPESMKTLTKEQTQMVLDYDKIIVMKDVQDGEPLYKIVSSNEWYIAVYMPNDMLEGYAEGDSKVIYIGNNNEYVPLNVRVEQMDPGYRETYVIFKSTKYVIDFLNMRSVQIKTSDSVRKGLKISAEAVVTRVFIKIPVDYVYESDKIYVIRKVAGEEIIVPIAIAERDDEFVYVLDDVENLTIGDELISKTLPVTTFILNETMTVQGVYRVNKGIAEFKKITLDEEPNSGYYILNPALKQGIKAYDNIVSDATGITDGQIIY